MKILHQIYIHVHDTISAINIATILKLALLIYTEFCVQLWKKKKYNFYVLLQDQCTDQCRSVKSTDFNHNK